MRNDTTMDKQRKLAALTGMALNYGKELPKELAKMWLRMLEDKEAEVVELAVEKVVTEYEYKTLPPFAVLAKAIRQVSGELEPDQAVHVAALSEWEIMLNEIARVGSYGKPVVSDTTRQVIRLMGGWDAVCQWETSKLEWKQKEFLDHWQSCHGAGDAMGLPASEILAIASGQHKRDEGPVAVGSLLSLPRVSNAAGM